MLEKLSFTNFKAWKCCDVEFGRITGLFGTNSSGKSSILQFLLMMKQTAQSSDRKVPLILGDDTTLVKLGSAVDMLHRHQGLATIELDCSWRDEAGFEIVNPNTEEELLASSPSLALRSEIVSFGNHLLTRVIEYTVGKASFALHGPEEGEGDSYELTASGVGRFRFKRTKGRPWELPGPDRFYVFPDQARTYHQNASFLSDLELSFEEMLQGIYHLGPLRQPPQRDYIWSGGEPEDIGQKGENVISAILAARRRNTLISRGQGYSRLTVEGYVGHWLKKLGLIHSFKVEEIKRGTNIYRVNVKRTANSPPVQIIDVGFGVSQILPVLVLCYYAPEGSTLLFEQPEIHLHPSVQAGLADVFLDAIKVRKVQIVVESHSEHLLQRLQRRVAEEEFAATDAALYFCQQNDSGAASLERLRMNMYGGIENWPEDFFGDGMEDLYQIHKAGMERRKEAAPS